MSKNTVVEDDKVALFSVVRVNHIGGNAGSLKAMDYGPHLLQVLNDRAILEM